MPEVNFFWDPLSDNILQERDETGAVTAEYTAEPGLFGNVISQNRGGVESQFHYDAQGSTLAVTDDNQNVTDTFAYSAFGEVTERTSTTEVPFQYIGRKGYYTDGLTGQIMARERPYEPVRARWLSCDPLLFPDSPNLYLYVQNSPNVSVDPTGEVACPPIAFPVVIPLSGIVGPFAAAVLIHPEPPVGVPIFLPSTQPLPPTQEQLDRIWRNSRFRKKKCKLVGSGFCDGKKPVSRKRCNYSCDGQPQEEHYIQCLPGQKGEGPPCPGADGSEIEPFWE